MLIGCLAITGVGVPFLAGFSGFHSKDAIVEQALSHWHKNAADGFSWAAVHRAGVQRRITAFYMFRLWYMTFAGKPRDHHRYDHAHESPRVMTGPLVLLAVFAMCARLVASRSMPWRRWRISASKTCSSRPGRSARSRRQPGVFLPDLFVPERAPCPRATTIKDAGRHRRNFGRDPGHPVRHDGLPVANRQCRKTAPAACGRSTTCRGTNGGSTNSTTSSSCGRRMPSAASSPKRSTAA